MQSQMIFALIHNFNGKFDFIIGNPPYVRIQNLNGRKEQLQKNYITASNGSIDLYNK